MILEIWTILNPIIRTFIYFTALYSIGSVIFKVHFYKYFNEEINIYCKKIIRNSALLGLLISILAFLSVAGNLGGEIESIFEIDLIELSFEQDNRVRREIWKALKNYEKDDMVTTFLEDIIRNDQKYYSVSDAFRSLVSLDQK